MGIAIEILVFGVIVVSIVVFLARPLFEARAERMKHQYREMGSDTERMLKEKVTFLEGELIEVKRQLTSLQETVDFVSKEVESQSGQTISTKQKQT